MVVCMLGQFSNLVSLSRHFAPKTVVALGRAVDSVASVAFSPGGLRIASDSLDLDSDGTPIRVWDSTTGQVRLLDIPIWSLRLHSRGQHNCLSLRTTAPIFILRTLGRAFIDLALFYLDFRRNMRPGSISQSLNADQIGLQYMITNYLT